MPSTKILSIILSMVLNMVSIIASCEVKVEGCSNSLSTFHSLSSLLHSPSSLLFVLVVTSFTSTSMVFFIIDAKEVDLLSLSHKENSPSKYSTY